MQRLLTFPEVASRYGICRQTIYDWMKNYGFPEPMRLGGRRFYKAQMLEEWEAKQTSRNGRRTRTFFHD